ncbi:MAG: response regulator [bacterium]|nr:response regulator [bacterium]
MDSFQNFASKPTILIVAGTLANLHFLCQALTTENFTICPVTDGLMALASAKTSPPDLILLDTMMPNISSYELCQQLKEHEWTHDIPIVFISANTHQIDRNKAFSFGAVDYITEPFHAEEVLARVKTQLHLRQLQRNLQQKNAQLEQEILERKLAENELSAANHDLQQTLGTLQKTQNHLIESEKMTELGQLVASIAHELSTPLSAVHSASDALIATLQPTLFKQLPEFLQSLSEKQKQDFLNLLDRASQDMRFTPTKEKRQLRKQLSRELEAHEIPDPRKVAELLVNIGIYGHLDELWPLITHPEHIYILKMACTLSGLQKNSLTLKEAATKALKIAKSLKTYSRYDRSGTRLESDLAQNIETALILYQNQIKHGIDIQRNYEEIPPIRCYPDELIQVWTNLIHNALQAMKERGSLHISLKQQGNMAVVTISDTGPGIPPEIQEKIFEPFFTTKASGEGSGLGLDIVKKIILKHYGQIHLESRPGETTFRVFLPMQPNDETHEPTV